MTNAEQGAAMAKCAACGSPISDTAQFCRVCGARIDRSTAATPAAKAPGAALSAGESRPRRKIPPLAIVAAALAAGAVVVIGVVALTGGGGDGDEASPVETTTPAEAPEVPPEPPPAAGGQGSDEQFDQIAIGQTMDEVRAILGEPEASETDLGGTRECWYFGLSEPGGGHTVCFDQDGLVMQRQ